LRTAAGTHDTSSFRARQTGEEIKDKFGGTINRLLCDHTNTDKYGSPQAPYFRVDSTPGGAAIILCHRLCDGSSFSGLLMILVGSGEGSAGRSATAATAATGARSRHRLGRFRRRIGAGSRHRFRHAVLVVGPAERVLSHARARRDVPPPGCPPAGMSLLTGGVCSATAATGSSLNHHEYRRRCPGDASGGA
jgi:hypothetical protein